MLIFSFIHMMWVLLEHVTCFYGQKSLYFPNTICAETMYGSKIPDQSFEIFTSGHVPARI